MIITEKAYAKINLALKIIGEQNGFHLLDSLVTTVNLFDTVTVKPRRDNKITVTAKGIPEYVYTHNPKRDNAYKAVERFMEEFGTSGADITVNKRIPLSSGMGGSSTDASAVLRALKKAYKIDKNIEHIANELGSDTAYLLNGGFARLQGKGEIITPLNLKNTINFVVVFCDSGVNTALCFKQFDQMQEKPKSGDITALINSFESGTPNFSLCENDLYEPAKLINSQVEKNLNALKSL